MFLTGDFAQGRRRLERAFETANCASSDNDKQEKSSTEPVILAQSTMKKILRTPITLKKMSPESEHVQRRTSKSLTFYYRQSPVLEVLHYFCNYSLLIYGNLISSVVRNVKKVTFFYITFHYKMIHSHSQNHMT